MILNIKYFKLICVDPILEYPGKEKDKTEEIYDFRVSGYSFFQKLNNYIRYFKYITLCLSREIKPEDWKYQSLWIRKEIPVKSKIIYESRSDSVNIIKDIFTEVYSLYQ